MDPLVVRLADGGHRAGARRRRRESGTPAAGGRIEGLDGLRGIAVLTVLAHHLWPHRLPGGFLGVDVFFVISGFLITTLLLRERSRAGYVDLAAFWVRRVRRLVPTVLVVVPVSLVAAWIVDPELLVGVDRQVLGALTFTSNWLEVGAGSDYFDETAPVLLETFWSLAVEEQFYLAWPIAFGVICGLATTMRHRAAAAIGLALASATLMAVLATGGNPTRVYYGTDTHLFGLMLGAALAFAAGPAAGSGDLLGSRRWQEIRPWAGFAAMGGLALLVPTVDGRSAVTYPGALLLASVLALVVVAALPGPSTAFQALHRLPPLVWIGERSYGIYLWHWPVILVVSAAAPATVPGADPSTVVVVVSLVLTFALATGTHRWVETPIRHHGLRSLRAVLDGLAAPRRPVPLLGAATASIVLVGAVVAVGSAPERSGAELAVERGQRLIDSSDAVPAAAGAQEASAVPVTSPAPEPSAAWPVALAEPPGDLIVGFGDSVLSGAAPALYARFPGISLDAEPIRQWKDAPALVEQAVRTGTIRPVVLLAFGTNAGLESEESVDALHRVLEAVGRERRVVLVNSVGVSEWVPSTNQTLASISAEHPNSIVADWYGVVAADPGLLHRDRTHPNMEGIDAYAALVADALQRLGPA